MNDTRCDPLARILTVSGSRRAAIALGALGLAGFIEQPRFGPDFAGSNQIQKERAEQRAQTDQSDVPVASYRVVAEYPHDPTAYTQGLDFAGGELFEGTGRTGQSTLRRVDLETGEVLQSVDLDPDYFGEGIVVHGDRIYQLTYRNRTCLVVDRETFAPLETFTYTGEGWGLTTDGERLIVSNGTNRLVFRDPATFAKLGQVDVFYGDQPIPYLNELEYIDGEVWANVWRTDFIARIDPETGEVRSWVDLTGILSRRDRRGIRVDVLNGIAHDAATGRLIVTGKWWPKMFEIELHVGKA